ncbi:hypothetical protein ASA1KI_19580 [Opitutales bacterium ASA1]|uniref:hypothetical protein n=1 Tax=Congregicoccus parvus TaxID=3081749 RepID=UPI002B2AC5FD|nr:hypothetical protein ASA1KI_19580 [Opitutales bacterium ASA1]
MSTSPTPASDDQPQTDLGEFAVQEVKYHLPTMLRELQIERSQSHFSKEILDQIEITKLFMQARKARARAK